MTLKIQNEYPELSKYLIEIPVTIPDIINPEINSRTLKDYYESLNSILKEYVPNHIDIKDK